MDRVMKQQGSAFVRLDFLDQTVKDVVQVIIDIHNVLDASATLKARKVVSVINRTVVVMVAHANQPLVVHCVINVLRGFMAFLLVQDAHVMVKVHLVISVTVKPDSVSVVKTFLGLIVIAVKLATTAILIANVVPVVIRDLQMKFVLMTEGVYAKRAFQDSLVINVHLDIPIIQVVTFAAVLDTALLEPIAITWDNADAKQVMTVYSAIIVQQDILDIHNAMSVIVMNVAQSLVMLRLVTVVAKMELRD